MPRGCGGYGEVSPPAGALARVGGRGEERIRSGQTGVRGHECSQVARDTHLYSIIVSCTPAHIRRGRILEEEISYECDECEYDTELPHEEPLREGEAREERGRGVLLCLLGEGPARGRGDGARRRGQVGHGVLRAALR